MEYGGGNFVGKGRGRPRRLQSLPHHQYERSTMRANPELLARITARSDIFGSKPIFHDLRLSVE